MRLLEAIDLVKDGKNLFFYLKQSPKYTHISIEKGKISLHVYKSPAINTLTQIDFFSKDWEVGG
jgi:hypothetical protein